VFRILAGGSDRCGGLFDDFNHLVQQPEEGVIPHHSFGYTGVELHLWVGLLGNLEVVLQVFDVSIALQDFAA